MIGILPRGDYATFSGSPTEISGLSRFQIAQDDERCGARGDQCRPDLVVFERVESDLQAVRGKRVAFESQAIELGTKRLERGMQPEGWASLRQPKRSVS
jgi:hypothetical protein